MLGRRRRMLRRRRRRVMVAGAVVVGATTSMAKMSQVDADKIQQTTGKAPEDMDEQELQQAMQQTGVQSQPVMEEDKQAMALAEAAEPKQEETAR